MNCDDFMLLVAKEGMDSPAMEEHIGGCEGCRELHRLLGTRGDGASGDKAADEEIIGQDIGPYKVTKLLGAGGMGRVYLGVHPEIGSRVAIKVFSKDWNLNLGLVARFFAEARATNVIGHENIVNVLDVGRLEDGRPYMVMEHLPGDPLSSLVGSQRLTDSLTVTLMLDVLSALTAAHAHQIVHRDLKPDNIFVSPEGRATLLDFGVAKLVPETVPGNAPTATGTVLGTPHYMSPEQATGDPVDTRSDVYAMGVILYECFTGRRPFNGSSVYQLMDQQVHHMPPRPIELRPDIGEGIDNVIMKALAKAPGERFATPGDMHEALSQCEVGEGSGVLAAGAWLEREASGTAATMPDGPIARRKEEEAKEKEAAEQVTSSISSFKLIVAASLVMASAAAVTVFLFSAAGGGSEPVPPTTALTSSVSDASGPTPIAINKASIDASTPEASLSDAAIDDASVAVAIADDAKPIRTKRRGTAPLSLLPEATRLATQRSPDAILHKITILWMNDEGRVDLRSKGTEVIFEFVSPSRVFKAAGKKRGWCIERVTYANNAPPKTSLRSMNCAEASPLMPPRCSMKKLLAKGRVNDNVPKKQDAQVAILRVSPTSRSSRASWSFQFHGLGSIRVPAC